MEGSYEIPAHQPARPGLRLPIQAAPIDRTPTAAALNTSGGRVVPQQFEQCQNRDGTCTSIWPGYRGTQCVTGLSGYRQCCNAAGTWPHIRECPLPGGGWEVTEAGCWGPCL